MAATPPPTQAWTRGKELSPEGRGYLCGSLDAGKSLRTILSLTVVPKSTVSSVQNTHILRQKFKSTPHPNRESQTHWIRYGPVKDRFPLMGIQGMKCSPYFPDLNPIEHVWPDLAEKLHSLYPELSTMTVAVDTIKARL